MLSIAIYAIYDYLFVLVVTATDCDKAFIGRSGNGVIKSYNYPFDYRHNLTCTYRIHLSTQTSSGERNDQICFKFHRYAIQLILSTSFPLSPA